MFSRLSHLTNYTHPVLSERCAQGVGEYLDQTPSGNNEAVQ